MKIARTERVIKTYFEFCARESLFILKTLLFIFKD